MPSPDDPSSPSPDVCSTASGVADALVLDDGLADALVLGEALAVALGEVDGEAGEVVAPGVEPVPAPLALVDPEVDVVVRAVGFGAAVVAWGFVVDFVGAGSVVFVGAGGAMPGC